MRRIDKFRHAARIVALSLPPVAMALIGLALSSRKKGGADAVAGKRPAADATRREGRG